MFLEGYLPCAPFFLDEEDQLYSKWPQMVFRRFTPRWVRDTTQIDFQFHRTGMQ